MRKILIATHFKLAEGFQNTLSYFAALDQIYIVNAFSDGVDYKKEIDQFFQENQEEEILAFSDIAFGSVNQYLTTYLGREKFHLISGTNLPVLLDLVLIPDDQPLNEEIIAQKVEEAKETIVYMNRFQRSADDEDE